MTTAQHEPGRTPTRNTRPWLIFQIEEGWRHDRVNRYRDDWPDMDRFLDRIRQALVPLLPAYRVAVLLYPVHFYNRNGWGESGGTMPASRIHPGLHHFLSFFEATWESTREDGIGVFLELYSSGNCTQQNGELSSLRPPPLRRTGEEERWGLSMDMDTLVELKALFPQALSGIRFHEIYGSDLVMKYTNDHAFYLDPDVVTGCIEACREACMALFWSDSCWLMNVPESGSLDRYVQGPGYHPYFDTEPYASLQRAAVQALGPNAIFSYANNNYSLANNLERFGEVVREGRPDRGNAVSERNPVLFATRSRTAVIDRTLAFDLPYPHHPLRDIPGASWGVSIQSWFWSEMIFTIAGRHYYPHHDDDCPVEVLAAFVLKALREGAAAIQFEPPWYLFSTGHPGRPGTRWCREGADDFSPRTNLLRLRTLLLSEASWPHRCQDPNEYFDRDLQRLVENDVGNPPRVYSQSTLVLLEETGAFETLRCLDFYSNGDRWVTGQPHRVPSAWPCPGLAGMTRLALDSRGEDVLVQGVEKDDGFHLRAVRQNGVLVDVVSDPACRHAIGDRPRAMAGLHLLAGTARNGKPDEWLFLYRAPSGSWSFEACGVEADWEMPRIRLFPAMSDAETLGTPLLRTLADTLASYGGNRIELAGIRPDAVLGRGLGRSRDALALLLAWPDRTEVRLIRPDGTVVSCDVPPTARFLAAVDGNGDRADEIVVLHQGAEPGSGFAWEVLAIGPLGLARLEIHPDPSPSGAGIRRPKALCGLRRTVMLLEGNRQEPDPAGGPAPA